MENGISGDRDTIFTQIQDMLFFPKSAWGEKATHLIFAYQELCPSLNILAVIELLEAAYVLSQGNQLWSWLNVAHAEHAHKIHGLC